MEKSTPASFKVFIAVISITALVFLSACLFVYYHVNPKYSVLLAFFLLVAFAFTTVGIYTGFRFKTPDHKLKRLNLVGLIGNLLIFLSILGIMAYVTLEKVSESPAIATENLLSKKWKPIAIEEGKRTEIPEQFRNTRMNFSADHTVVSTDKGNSSTGDWKYDEQLKTITIVDKTTKETVVIGVKSITENEFAVEIGKPGERTIILYMVPDSKR